MMRFLPIFLFLLFCSCSESNQDFKFLDYSVPSETMEEAWICYNPTSSIHEDYCGDACFDPPNANSFCWLITDKDCNVEHEFDWQRKF